MTCVVASPLHSLNEYFPNLTWPPMSQTNPSRNRVFTRGYGAADSSGLKKSSSTTKKRASRAGTRSVSTLSAAQLERKRANDREAQRAIRQRTKDHIDQLERTIEELRDTQSSTQKQLYVSQQRSQDLEDEVNYLRSKLAESGFYPIHESTNRHGESSIIPLSSGVATTQSGPKPGVRPDTIPAQYSQSGTGSHSPSSRQGSYSSGAYMNSAPSSSVSLASSGAMLPSLTSWRSQDSTTSGGTDSEHKALGPDCTDSLYNPNNTPDRVEWPVGQSASEAFGLDAESSSRQFGSPYHHNQQPDHQHYGQSPVHDYSNSTVAPPRSFPTPLMTTDFGSTGQFQMTTASFVSPATYSVTPVQVPEYSPSNQLHPSSLPPTSFPSTTDHGQDSYRTRNGIPFRQTDSHVFPLNTFAST